MRRRAARSLDRSLYRAALSLCPAGFRSAHGQEMARDFDEACAEAAIAGGRALWTVRAVMAVDVVRTLVVQWVRTGLPAIGAASVLVPLALAEGLATVARRATIEMPAGEPHAEVAGVLLLAVTSVVLIAMTIILNLWVSRPGVRRRR